MNAKKIGFNDGALKKGAGVIRFNGKSLKFTIEFDKKPH